MFISVLPLYCGTARCSLQTHRQFVMCYTLSDSSNHFSTVVGQISKRAVTQLTAREPVSAAADSLVELSGRSLVCDRIQERTRVLSGMLPG